MPDLDPSEYKKIEDYIGNAKLLNSFLKLEGSTLESIKDNKPISPIVSNIYSFLSQFKTLDSIFTYFNKIRFLNSGINALINLADRFLSVHNNIQCLKYYSTFSRFGSVSSTSSSIWYVLELIGIIPEQKSFWLKIIDGVISAFGYIVGLGNNILDLLYNPNPIRKIQAVIEIVLASIAFVIHIYNLINN